MSETNLLTIEQLHRELMSLREIVKLRLDQMDKDSARIPSALYVEKFDSIQKQFDERDMRLQSFEAASRTAVDTALVAQKEVAAAEIARHSAALIQSENSATKQVDTMLAQSINNVKTIDEKLASFHGRLDRVERVAEGVRKPNYLASILAIAAIIISISLIGINIIQVLHPTPTMIQTGR